MKRCFSSDGGEIHTTRNGYHLVIEEMRGRTTTVNIDNNGRMTDTSGAAITPADISIAVGFLRRVRAPEKLIRRLH